MVGRLIFLDLFFSPSVSGRSAYQEVSTSAGGRPLGGLLPHTCSVGCYGASCYYRAATTEVSGNEIRFGDVPRSRERPQNTINFIPNPHAGGTVVGARADPDMTHPFLRQPGRSLALVGQDMKRALVQGC